MNQTEIDELRRLHEADSAKIINAMANIDWQQHLMNAGGCFHVEDDGRLCGRADRWSGHGEPDFHMFVPLYVAATKLAKGNALPRLLAALEEARAERDRARQKIQAMEEQAMADEDGMSMRPLDGRLRKVEAERDALKATLAKHAESERAWCELATERGAKLAALVEATAEVHEKLRINADGKATVTVGKAIALRRELGEALAAAKVQP